MSHIGIKNTFIEGGGLKKGVPERGSWGNPGEGISTSAALFHFILGGLLAHFSPICSTKGVGQPPSLVGAERLCVFKYRQLSKCVPEAL